jgi:flagella basal body P-ring formation protein FlgA
MSATIRAGSTRRHRGLAVLGLAALFGGTILGASAAAATGPAAAGGPEPAEPILVSLRPESTLRGTGIRLGDVADIKGPDPALVTRLRAVEIGRTPLPGLSRTLDLPYIKARLRMAHLDPEALTWDVPPVVSVVAASQRLTGSELVAAAREQVEALRASDGGPASIQPTVIPPDLTLPDGSLELKARVRPGVELTGTVPVTVEAWVDGTQVRALSVALRVVPLVEVLVAARLIPRGAMLDPEDLRVERRGLVAGVEPLREPAAALGQRAIRRIAPGEVILPAALELPPLVRRGDIVTLTVQGPGLMAVTKGEAREDGKAGQIIRVRNRSSGREVYGQVEGERAVRVSY